MARSAISASTLLAKFEAIAEAIEEGETFNLTEFAGILRMSVTNFRKTYLDLDPGFPFLKIGHGGDDYEIDGKAALKHLAAKQRERIASQDGRAARIAELAAVSQSEDGSEQLTVDEYQKIDRIQDAQLRRRLTMNELVAASLHRQMVGDMCRMAGDRFGSVATELDAGGLWPKMVREAVIDWAKRQRLELFTEFEGYLNEDEHGSGKHRARVPAARKR